MRCRNSTSEVSIHGPAIASTATAAITFGTNDSVASWICVAAWKMLTTQADHEHGEQDRRRDHEQHVEALLAEGEDLL